MYAASSCVSAREKVTREESLVNHETCNQSSSFLLTSSFQSAQKNDRWMTRGVNDILKMAITLAQFSPQTDYILQPPRFITTPNFSNRFKLQPKLLPCINQRHPATLCLTAAGWESTRNYRYIQLTHKCVF